MGRITGVIPCEQSCTVPEGVELAEVPPPRHQWGDVFGCPNEGCGRFFMVFRGPAGAPEVADGR